MDAQSRSWDMFNSGVNMAEDEEVVLLFSHGMETFTSKEVANVLARKGFSPEQCRVLEENKVDGKILATFSRADLTDLFPADFITRKKLWDFICNMKSPASLSSPASSSGLSLDGSTESFGFSPSRCSTPRSTDSTLSTMSPYSSMDEDTLSQSQSQAAQCKRPQLKRTKPREYMCVEGKPEQVTTGQSGKIGIENYQPLDLPSDFQILNSFGKKVNQALDEFSEPGSVPHDIVRKIVRQVTEHIEAENPRPSMKTVEWVAWSYCMKFPGLKQVNPMETLKQSNQAAFGMVGMPFKEWGLLAEKIRRALENKRYQEKRKSSTSTCSLVQIKRLKSDSDQATPAQGDIDDEASIARHSKRLQDELRKSSPDKKVINELMDAEFSARRSFITKTDVRTRMRATVAKYHILSNGNELEEELLRILKFEKNMKCNDVEVLLTAWKTQHEKLQGFISQQFSLRKDEITGAVLLKIMPQLFTTKVHKKKEGKNEGVFAVISSDEETPPNLSPYDPYLLVHSQDADDSQEAYTVMVGEQKYCDISEGEDSLGHAIVQLLAFFYVYHLEYPQSLRNTYFFLQQFVLGDHNVSSTPRILNRYHEAIQKYLVFANSL